MRLAGALVCLGLGAQARIVSSLFVHRRLTCSCEVGRVR